MKASTHSDQYVLIAAVDRVLRPLVRILLRYGVTYQAFAELAKKAYVEVAEQEFSVEGRKQSVSRVSVLTGLTRKEVARLHKIDVPIQDEELIAQHHRAARVVTAWVRESRYQDGQGRPAVLPIDGESVSFSDLVKSYSGDMPVRAVLDELERVGAVDRIDDQHVKLVVSAYIPRKGEASKLSILGSDVAGLISTIAHNIEPDCAAPLFQRKVFYDNLPTEVIPELRALAAAQGQQLLEKLDGWMATRDRGSRNNTDTANTTQVGIGVFYFEADMIEGGQPCSHN